MNEKICIACGMPMTRPEDYPGQNCALDYCLHCARPDGSMQSFEEKRAGLAAFLAKTQGFDPDAALPVVDSMMARLPAWRDRFPA